MTERGGEYFTVLKGQQDGCHRMLEAVGANPQSGGEGGGGGGGGEQYDHGGVPIWCFDGSGIGRSVLAVKDYLSYPVGNFWDTMACILRLNVL